MCYMCVNQNYIWFCMAGISQLIYPRNILVTHKAEVSVFYDCAVLWCAHIIEYIMAWLSY